MMWTMTCKNFKDSLIFADLFEDGKILKYIIKAELISLVFQLFS